MKKITFLIISAFVLSACSGKKAQKKAIIDAVLNIHEKVMGAEEQLMENKMALDTLIKKYHLPEKDSAAILDAQLAAADGAMNTWMHNFDVEQKGKSDEDVISYFQGQKKQITAIDSQLDKAITESGKYLTKIRAK